MLLHKFQQVLPTCDNFLTDLRHGDSLCLDLPAKKRTAVWVSEKTKLHSRLFPCSRAHILHHVFPSPQLPDDKGSPFASCKAAPVQECHYWRGFKIKQGTQKCDDLSKMQAARCLRHEFPLNEASLREYCIQPRVQAMMYHKFMAVP